jgi:hypothetical protein
LSPIFRASEQQSTSNTLLAPMIITGTEVGTASPGGRLEINVAVHSFNKQWHHKAIINIQNTYKWYSKFTVTSIPFHYISIHPIKWQEQQILLCKRDIILSTESQCDTNFIILGTESQCDTNFRLCTPCCFHQTTSLICPPASILIVTHCHTCLSQYWNLCHPQCLSGLLCVVSMCLAQGYYQWHTQDFFFRRVQQIQLRAEGREKEDLGVVVP